MGLTAADYLQAQQALLPPGPAWALTEDAPLTQLLDGQAQELARIDARAEQLADEADPRTAQELLPDWERVLALPDACTPAGLNRTDRQLAITQRLTAQGGLSRAYYIGVAEELGEPAVTITEFSPAHCNSNCNAAIYSEADRFTWRVDIPHAPDQVRLATCNSDCNVALQEFTPSAIECVLQARKPAHTSVIFAYAP